MTSCVTPNVDTLFKRPDAFSRPALIAFCEEARLDYVSCSPYRIPIARLAAARAALGRKAASTAWRPGGRPSGWARAAG